MQLIFIASKFGRLGNQLSLFAHFIACAIENNFTVVNLSFEDYAKYFETTSNDILCRYPNKKLMFVAEDIARHLLYLFIFCLQKILKTLKISDYLGNFKVIVANSSDDTCFLDSQEFLESAKNKIVLCRGYFFRDYQNVIKYHHEIKAYFILKKTYKDSVDNLINQIRDKYKIVIGIHIRQGDYKQYKNGEWFYESYQYLKFIKKIELLFPDQSLAFLICSDTKQDTSLFQEINAFFSDKSAIEDLYLLSQCDYIVGPPSSYSRWASFYGSVPLYVIRNINQEISLDKFEINSHLALNRINPQ